MKRMLVSLAIVASVIGIGVSSAAAKPVKQATTVTVTMADPGCHWFLVAGKHLKTLTAAGPVSLRNYDEATLRVMGMGMHGMKLAPVGHSIVLGKGVYRITMVGQAPDDNHLLLTVK